MKLHYFAVKPIRYYLIMLLGMVLLASEVAANALDTTSICNAGFTVKLDTTRTFPVYTFTALETDNSKTFSWNIGGSLLRTGPEIDHIFFDAGGWMVSLTVADDSDACSTNQRVDVSGATQAPVGSCFFNTWKENDSTNTYAFETWMPWYTDMSYSIDFGDGTTAVNDPEFAVPLSHTYSAPGTYEVCQTMNEDSCGYCIEIIIDSTELTGCNAEFTYQLDTSYGAWIYTFNASEIDSAKNYSWTTSERGQVPFSGSLIEGYVFPAEGTYPVELTVFNDFDTCSTVQQIYSPNTESCTFGLTQQKNKVRVKAAWGLNNNWFDDLTIDTTQYGIDKLYYTIDLGDGTAVNGTLFDTDSLDWNSLFIPDIEHEYQMAGTYDICYAATDSLFYNCQQCKSVIIEESDIVTCDPTFTYSIDSTSTNNWIYTFTAADPDSFKRFFWGFEEQRIGFGRVEQHIFTEGGAQEIKLSVFENQTDTCSSSVTVFPPESEGCFMNITQIDENTFDFYPTVNASSGTVFYTMNFGDSISTSGEHIGGRNVGPFTYNYRNGGTFDVCFTATDSANFSCEVCEPIEVILPQCFATFVYNQLDSTNQFQYLFTALEISGLYDYRWEINGQTVSENELFEFTFPSSGVYTVDLLMTNVSSGNICTSRKAITIGSISATCPTSFVYNQVDSSNTYRYLFTPLIIDSNKSFLWKVNDSIQSNKILFDFTFPEDGVYDITLQVTENGDNCSTTKNIVIDGGNSFCDASFDLNIDASNSLSYTFIPRSDSAVAYEWFVNGVLSSEESSFHYTFPDSGVYEIRLDLLKWWDSCSSIKNISVKTNSDSTQADSLYINGSLFADLIPVDGGNVALYQKENDNWVYSSETVATKGEFTFENLSKGRYLIHARGDEFVHQAFIPTYFVNGVGWQDAYKLDLTGSAEEVKITLIRSQALSAGQGQLQGRVVSDEMKEPVVILLKDRISGRTVKWTVSGEEHAFNFDQLPFGKYTLTVEKPSQSFSRQVDLNEDLSNLTNIVLKADEILGRDEALGGGLSVYPTQIEDKVFLSNQGYTGGDTSVELRSISGKLLMSQRLEIKARETIELTLPILGQGMYLMRIIDNEGKISVTKLIK
ncbi:MAG: T9SS type A sorting domain-containing protein [Bacteroidota bacterium]